MAQETKAEPAIIKRKKVVQGGGHHGGAWKVAYADFVTAMMAFFLLMWLLNATTENQRKGIADYFSPTIPVNRISGGGDGAFGGDSALSAEQLAQSGIGAAPHLRPEPDSSERSADTPSAAGADQELQQLAAQIAKDLSGDSGEVMHSDRLARRILTRLTDEGLIIEFFDLEGEPLFAPDSPSPEPILSEIAAMLGRVLRLTRNQIAVNGHVRAYPEVLRVDPVWDLSSARAQEVRRKLEATGLDRKRIQRVTGFADRKPAVPAAMAVRNNRIEVIILRRGR